MQAKIKLIQSKMGYRYQSIVFSDDGSVNATIQVCAISGSEDAPTFSQIAQQGHYLQKTEVDAMLESPCTEDEAPKDLRGVLEARLDAALRAKGLLNF